MIRKSLKFLPARCAEAYGDGHSLKNRDADSLENLEDAGRQSEFFFNDGTEYINCEGNSDFRLHYVLACSVKYLDSKVLLDPVVVGEEDEVAVIVSIVLSNPEQLSG